MLSAASGASQPLDVFRLVLSLIERRETQIPAALRNHFSTVVAQAKTLTQQPGTKQENLLPESIDLAFEMRKLSELRQRIEPVTSVDSVDPTLAAQLLKAMEVRAAY